MTVQDDLPGIPFKDGAPYQQGDVAFSPSTGRVWTLIADDNEPWAGTMQSGRDWDWYGASAFPEDTRLLLRDGRLVTPPPPYDPAMAEPGDVVTAEDDERTFFYAPDAPRDYHPWVRSDGVFIGPEDLPAGLTLVLRGGKPVTSDA
ncbi:hypothetical protein [Parafrankia sp. EUN1f]|uniref:hypothetical protein n=1 Tax=Parafrankia sp. EUN1f TaxID=102897 RepID=UPI0001C46D24|nr:hypothetical protein [Parafrankia sp. EUN1f]EFC80082.1 hypothetical protein FrEUN1fDRAFT_6809 [Parafrankia sp. EUN1f]